MRNVDPTGRTPPCRARPFRIAPMPCSRTPKWTLRAPQVPAATSPPFLKTTFVEFARSADPPMSSGSFGAMTFSTLPAATRVAWASPGGGERRVERTEVVSVRHALHVPAVALEPLGRIVREREIGLPVNSDAVVVVDPDQPAELQMTGERAGLVRDALHQVAVGREEIGAMVDDGMARPVEQLSEVGLRERHSHGVPDALTERAGRGLDAGSESVF